ncbi:hypothetical protein DPMN_142642 [Dreissena polymorpha]|uniref:Uncharacterized protein n=1 Tax=Dreissena polymorpha TaxID=45954 RepID=A0A9D4GBN2_DREPO|nr:hypothetical protein DPMN_142642 [Dreissena polymorpha]
MVVSIESSEAVSKCSLELVDYKQANVTLEECWLSFHGMGVVVIWHGEWFGWSLLWYVRKNAPPTGGHVFLSNWNQFQTCPNIIGTNLLTKCHDDRTINMASRVLTGGHVFPPTRTIFELIQDIIRTNHLTKVLTMKNAPPPDIIRTNLLTKFHEDKKINVASRVLTK